MQISVTFRNMDPSDSLRTYAEEKIMRLKKYVALPVDVQVVLAKQKYRNSAEIKVVSAGKVMKCRENTEDMYSSIDLALDKMERQVQKLKDKIRGHRSPAVEGEQTENFLEEKEPEEESGPRIVESQKINTKPMSVEEAVMQMQVSEQDFFVFVNSVTHDVNVIYRQPDGNIGLIEAKTPGKE